MRKLILDDLLQIFRSVLKNDNLIITELSTNYDVENWDSINTMILINRIEKKFNIKIPIKEVMNVKSIGDIITIVESKTIK